MVDLKPLRDLIASGESEGAVAKQGARSAYDVIVGYAWEHPAARPARPLTTMAIAEVWEWQRTAIRVYRAATGEREGFSAAGRYQILLATLTGIEARGVVDEAQLFDAAAQDACCDDLIRRRGLARWLSRETPDDVFAGALAQEWASLPVLQYQMGRHRRVAPGESYYAGDRKNAAHVSVEAVRAALAQLRAPGAPAAPNAAAAYDRLIARVDELWAMRERMIEAMKGDSP